MSNCVVRFGGNSLSERDVLETFATLARESADRLIVVVSAIPELLNFINQGVESIKNGNSSSESMLEGLKRLVEHKLRIWTVSNIDEYISEETQSLFNLLKGIELTGDYSASLKDQVNSFSERITTNLLGLYLESKSVTAKVISPENIGLVVTEEYGNASVLLAKSGKLESSLPDGIVLIPGSFGVTESGKIARLGDHSADYSAAAVAKLTGSKSLELWEIDREFRTGDLNYIPDSQVIGRLTYAEASELSYFSGQTVHPRIIEPLISDHIPIHVYKLENKGKVLSTIINSESFVSSGVVKSVVHTEEIAVIKLDGPGVGFKPGILAEVTTAFHRSAINIRMVITSQISINIIINKEEGEKARQICQKLSLSSVNEISIENSVSLIAVIGCGMQSHHGVSAKLFTAVARQKINVLLSGSGASDLVSYLIVKQDDTANTLTEIHDIFFNRKY